MAGVIDGQPVNQSITNAAFLEKNADDVTTFKIDLNNSADPASGAAINNIQREFNALSSYTGKPVNAAISSTPSWTNNDVGLSSDSLKARADSLTQKFNGTAGHAHTGLPGDAKLISAPTLADVPLSGYFNQGVSLVGVTGSSTSVNTQMSGKIPSSGSASTGVVVDAPYNKVVLRYSSGSTAGDEIVDGSGNQVYGRVTYSLTNWTLSYFVDLSGVETAYSFGSATGIAWYYQELYNPMVSPPVYNTMAFIPSDNTTADVVAATTTQAGKVLLSTAAGTSVGSTAQVGTSTRVAREDHAHDGVHSLSAYAVSGSALKNDVQLEAGTNITLSYSGGRIKIDGTGATGEQEQPSGPTNGVNTLFGPLTKTPSSASSILVFLDGVNQESTLWSLTGNSIQFVTAPAAGQKVWVFYLTAGIVSLPPAPTGTLVTEYRTISSGESSAKQLTLAATPTYPVNTLVDVIGGCAQVFNIDFSIAANVLTWNGYALDGILTTGDILRIQFWT